MRISIVTCSYNQGDFLGRTIDSVRSQDYPDVEHIVVDGMSSDQTPEVLARYPHLHVVREPDRGQADAINKGFRLATGDVLGFLNSDDTLEPGALRRVADEIYPARGRHVVMGRCRFIDEQDRFLGREHPCDFKGHRRVLEVWKGHCLPQPAVFWTREAWQRCGPLDENEKLVLDYDLFCRLSRHYEFHVIDQVLANYRLHARSKTCVAREEHVLEESIRVSRKYWGSPTQLRFWRVLASYLSFRLDRRGRGLDLYVKGRKAAACRRPVAALAYLGSFALLTPDLLATLVVLPGVAAGVPELFERMGLASWSCSRRVHPFTEAWRGFTGEHSDHWVGPHFETTLEVRPGDTRLRLEGNLDIAHCPSPLVLELLLDGRRLGCWRLPRRPEFVIEAALNGCVPGRHQVTVRSSTHAVHADYRGNRDYRPLSFRLRRLAAEPSAAPAPSQALAA